MKSSRHQSLITKKDTRGNRIGGILAEWVNDDSATHCIKLKVIAKIDVKLIKHCTENEKL